MDLGNRTLNGIMETIAAENDLIGYNTYRNRKGHIVVKISYVEPTESEMKVDHNSEFDSERKSFKKLSKNQSKRNFERAKNFRDQNSVESQTDNSIETPRNSEEVTHSTSTPNPIDVSHCTSDSCLLASPVIHVETVTHSDHDHSHEEQFHDVSDSTTNFVTPDLAASKPSVPEEKSVIWRPKPLPERKPIYDKEKYDSPWDHAKQPCDNVNCSFGPCPDQIDYSVVGVGPIIKQCPHCDLVVCILCRKYRGQHRKYFITKPPWD